MWDWRAKRGRWSRASWHTIPTGRYKLVSSREDASGIPYQGARFPDFPPSKLGGNPEAGATPLRGHDKHRERERERVSKLVLSSWRRVHIRVQSYWSSTMRLLPSSSPTLESIKFIRDYAGPVTRWKINVLVPTELSTLRELVFPRLFCEIHFFDSEINKYNFRETRR